MNTSSQPASTNTQRSLRGEDSQKSREQIQDIRNALYAALAQPTRQAQPFHPSRTQRKAVVAATAAATFLEALAASITAVP